MIRHATSSFVFDERTDIPVDSPDGELIERVTITKSFTGDIRGASVVYMYGYKTRLPTSNSYVAFERFSVSMHGRSGTFVLRHAAMRTAREREGTWVVVADSGTGELEGISGTGALTFHADGTKTFDFDYRLPCDDARLAHDEATPDNI